MADHVRAIQAFAVAKKIDEIRRQNQRGGGGSFPDPFILCGDLNSDPLSGACQLLNTRTLAPDHHDCWKYLHSYKWDVEDEDVNEMVDSGSTAEERRKSHGTNDDEEPTGDRRPAPTLATPPRIELPDSFPNLRSGCQPDPVFTQFSLKFAETLDYVLASQISDRDGSGFSPEGSAPMPALKDIEAMVSMVGIFIVEPSRSHACSKTF